MYNANINSLCRDQQGETCLTENKAYSFIFIIGNKLLPVFRVSRVKLWPIINNSSKRYRYKSHSVDLFVAVKI